MKIIISPAKKMNVDNDSFGHKSMPIFIDNAREIREYLKSKSYIELKSLWKCNDEIAKLNIDRLDDFDLLKNLTPALFAYDGIQYKSMSPNVFENQHLDYVRDNVRIISGLYGVLKAFDGVIPYRLEMQSKLSVGKSTDLYKYWGDKLAKELAKDEHVILNLASVEYSKAVKPHVPKGMEYVTCTFYQNINGKLVSKATGCKKARGEMVRYLAEHNIYNIEDVKTFSQDGYTYNKENSNKENIVFVKGEK